MSRGGGAFTFVVDTLTNRYTQIDSAAISHDDAGSLVQDRQGYRTRIASCGSINWRGKAR